MISTFLSVYLFVCLFVCLNLFTISISLLVLLALFAYLNYMHIVLAIHIWWAGFTVCVTCLFSPMIMIVS